MRNTDGVLKRAKVMTVMYVITCVIMAVCTALNLLMKFAVLPQSPTFMISFAAALIMAVVLNGYSFYSRKKGGGYASSIALKYVVMFLIFAWAASAAFLIFMT